MNIIAFYIVNTICNNLIIKLLPPPVRVEKFCRVFACFLLFSAILNRFSAQYNRFFASSACEKRESFLF